MELREIGEFGLIARIRSRLPALSPRVFEGIGDDAAISSLDPGADLVSTVDLLVEGVHYDLSLIIASPLGRKSLAVNLSDFVAMGGTSRFALISLAIPSEGKVEFIDEFLGGLGAMAKALPLNPVPSLRIMPAIDVPQYPSIPTILGRVGAGKRSGKQVLPEKKV